MSKLFNGSMCLTDLIDLAKKADSAFNRSQKNGKVYCNVTVWVNDEPDRYGNSMSFQLNSIDKEKSLVEGKRFFGNAKEIVTSKPLKEGEFVAPDDDDLPF